MDGRAGRGVVFLAMKRRALLAAPLACLLARNLGAQGRERVRCLGYLSGGADASVVAPQLAELGHVVGRNLRIDVRIAPDDEPKVLAAARELVRPDVDALLAWGLMKVSALAQLTKTIPIVCGGTLDPVGSGIARSLRRPGMNITGLSYGGPESAPIVIGLYKLLVPRIRRVVVMHPRRLESYLLVPHQHLIDETRRAGIAWEFVVAETPAEFEKAYSALSPAHDVAWPLGYEEESVKELAAIAIRHRIVSDGTLAENVRQGMLICYGYDFVDKARRLAAILDKVLRGGNPAEIPFELPDRTSLTLNRATARAMGLVVHPDILLRATEVID